jgi:heptose I phosphotransferase
MTQVDSTSEPQPAATGSWWQRLTQGVRRLCARADWVAHLGDDWSNRIMQADIDDDFHAKQGRSTCRWVLEGAGRRLVVYLKRHYELPRRHGLLAALWPSGDWSPGMTERRNLEWAREQGLRVPAVVAAGEYLGPWGKLQSFLAIEELTEMLPLHEAIPLASRQMPAARFRLWKAGLVRELARLARVLHDRSRFHKDLYLCHFFIRRADISHVPNWRNRIFMIDFHRLAYHPLTRFFWVSKDLGQMLYSAQIDGVDARDRLRFWHAYLGGRTRSPWARLLRRMVLMRGRIYSRHNAKQQSAAERKAA